MKRRKFIQTSSLMTLPVLLSGMEVTAITKSNLESIVNGDNDKVLVLIQLNGGNDGLNTIIPMDQYDDLQAVRSSIILPEDSLLPIDNDLAMHPAMTGLKELYEEEKVAIVQGVGYPDQNRSHFRSTDIWTTASASDEFLTTGWIGRHFELGFPNYPDNFPNADCPDPFAITLGFVVSETCQGTTANYSFSVADPENLIKLDETVGGEIDNSCYGQQLGFVKETIRQTNAYTDTVAEAYEKGNNLVDYPADNDLANQLKVVANLISGGLQTKVYVVSLGGFDLHANQVVGGQPEQGFHTELLGYISTAVSAFQKDLVQLGVEERVVGMTFSEFGRRIRENGSFGTDHGSAAPLVVFGSCVNGGVLGANAVIDRNVDIQEGVPMQYDFRSVYATMLIDWFEADEADVREVLYDDFQHLPILKDCSIVNDTDETPEITSKVYPNPTSDYIVVEFESSGEHTCIEIYDVIGSRVKQVCNKKLTSGLHKVNINLGDLSTGTYFVRRTAGHQVDTVKFVKV